MHIEDLGMCKRAFCKLMVGAKLNNDGTRRLNRLISGEKSTNNHRGLIGNLLKKMKDSFWLVVKVLFLVTL